MSSELGTAGQFGEKRRRHGVFLWGQMVGVRVSSELGTAGSGLLYYIGRRIRVWQPMAAGVRGSLMELGSIMLLLLLKGHTDRSQNL